MNAPPNQFPATHIAYVGVGSNRGDRMEHLSAAFDALRRTNGVLSIRSAPVYETLPVDAAGPGNFFNTVFELMTVLSVGELFRRLQTIEVQLGRVHPDASDAHCARSGPRTIDLDLLFFDAVQRQSPALAIPHPRLHTRAFVLVPLHDLAPDFVHPLLGRTISDLLGYVKSSEEMVGRLADAVGIAAVAD